MTIKRRLLFGISANAYGQVINLIIQILTLPIFISIWGAEKYGQWLIISAIPAYLAMADFGMLNVSATRMTMLAESGRVQSAANCFVTAAYSVLSVILLLVLLGASLLYILPSLGFSTSGETTTTLVLLLLSALASLAIGVPDAVFRASRKYSTGVFAMNTLRLVEWSLAVASLYYFRSFEAVAAAYLLSKSVFAVLFFLASIRLDGNVDWYKGKFKLKVLKLQVKPSLQYLLFPAANAISIQGMVLVVGYIWGAAAVSAFSAYRTMARTTAQVVGVFSHPLVPEFSALVAKKRTDQLVELYRKANALVFGVALLMASALLLGGNSLVTTWSRGEILPDSSLLVASVLYAVASSLWYVPRMYLFSTNTHGKLGYWVAGTAIVSLPVIAAASSALPVGLNGAMVGLLVMESIVLVVATMMVRSLIKALAS